MCKHHERGRFLSRHLSAERCSHRERSRQPARLVLAANQLLDACADQLVPVWRQLYGAHHQQLADFHEQGGGILDWSESAPFGAPVISNVTASIANFYGTTGCTAT